jgi:hypothetical protein
LLTLGTLLMASSVDKVTLSMSLKSLPTALLIL